MRFSAVLTMEIYESVIKYQQKHETCSTILIKKRCEIDGSVPKIAKNVASYVWEHLPSDIAVAFFVILINLAPIHYIQTLGQDILHGVQISAPPTIGWGTFVQTCPRGGDIGEVNLPYGMYKKQHHNWNRPCIPRPRRRP